MVFKLRDGAEVAFCQFLPNKWRSTDTLSGAFTFFLDVSSCCHSVYGDTGCFVCALMKEIQMIIYSCSLYFDEPLLRR